MADGDTRTPAGLLAVADKLLDAAAAPIEPDDLESFRLRIDAIEPVPSRFDRYVDAAERERRRLTRELWRLVKALLNDARSAPLEDAQRESYRAAILAIADGFRVTA